jgi:hypothetical protein
MSCIVWAALQFNVVPDDGREGWQFNNVLVRGLGEGIREIQFNDMLVE